MTPERREPLIGFLLCTASFVLWGTLTLYWSLLLHLPPVIVLCYRIIWSWFFVFLLVAAGRDWSAIRALFSSPRVFWLTVLSSLLINFNWGIYIYAISIGKVIEASLGSYICPLVSTLAGVFLFGERLRPLQALGILLAFSGVGYMVFGYGEVPYIALGLAGSFVIYGVLHKYLKMRVLESMLCEMSVAVLPALAYLVFFSQGKPFFSEPLYMMLIIMGAGPLTALPLMGFAASVKRLSLTTIGVIQYVSPSMTFSIGILYFKEPVNRELLLVFCFIWSGIAVYIADSLLFHRRQYRDAKD